MAARPLSLGSPPRRRAPARAALRQPISDRVICAGEAAATDGWHGTVAGAYLSGGAASRALLGAPPCRTLVID
jgi:hypothetical protein